MPLSSWVKLQLDTSRAFLADRDRVLLELRAMPEQERMVGKLLVGIAEDADGLFAGVDAPFADPASYCAELEAALGEVVEEAKGVLAEDGATLDVPAPDPRDGLAAEVRLVAYGERIARELYPTFEYVALVLKPGPLTDHSAFVAWLVRLCAASENGRFKIILISDPARPCAESVPMTRPRLAAFTLASDGASRSALGAFLTDPLRRVLAYDAPRRGQTWMATELAAVTAGSRRVVVKATDVRFWRPVHFYGRAAEQIVRECHEKAGAREGNPIEPFLAEVSHPRGRPEAEAAFVELLERIAAAWLPPDGTLVVLLGADLESESVVPGEARALGESLVHLARAAVTPRIKIVVVGRDLAVARLEHPPMQTHQVRLDGATIEAGIQQRLTAPDLPKIEKLRLTSAMASFAITHGDPGRALTLGLECLTMGEQSGAPEELALAHFGLGGTLYRCGAVDKAAASYTTALDLAIARDNLPLAAHALLGIGNCYFVIRHHQEALGAYTVARTYFQKLGHAIGESYSLTWAGEAQAAAGRPDQAVLVLNEALACCERAGEGAQHSQAEILQRLAGVYAKVGRSSESKKYMADARALGASAPVATEP